MFLLPKLTSSYAYTLFIYQKLYGINTYLHYHSIAICFANFSENKYFAIEVEVEVVSMSSSFFKCLNYQLTL